MAAQAAAATLLAWALLPRASAQMGFRDDCNADNRTGCRNSPTLEDNNNVVGFGIVTAIIILVVANLVICIARCLLTPQAAAATNGSAPRRRRPPREVPLIRRTYSVNPVYVVNPGGSLRIGKQDSKKPGGVHGDGQTAADPADPADLAERGMAPSPTPPPRRTRSGPLPARGEASEEV